MHLGLDKVCVIGQSVQKQFGRMSAFQRRVYVMGARLSSIVDQGILWRCLRQQQMHCWRKVPTLVMRLCRIWPLGTSSV
jgi:hypothetical protein